MPKGTVSGSIPPKVMGSFNRLVVAAKTCLYTSLPSNGLAFPRSMMGRSSSTKKCQTEAARQPRTSEYHAELWPTLHRDLRDRR